MPTQMTAKKIIDARNEQEFPSLGNASVTIRQTVPLNTRQFGTSGLARTKENFPALGGGTSHTEPVRLNTAGNASTLLFKTPKPPPKSATNNASKTNPPKASVPDKTKDFPALPGSSSSAKSKRQNLEADLIETASPYNLSTAVSSKHRTLVQSYESVSSSNANQKIKTVQRVETKTASAANGLPVSINSSANFPALGGSSGATAPPQWLAATSSKKQPVMSKKLKVAPAPLLTTTKEEINASKSQELSKKSKINNDKKKDRTNDLAPEKLMGNKKNEKNSTKKFDEKENVKKDHDKNLSSPQSKSEKKANKNGALASNSVGNNVKPVQNGHVSPNDTINSYSSVAYFTMPPPGFPPKTEKVAKIPPGFEGTLIDSNKTFLYISPSNALLRNQVTVYFCLFLFHS